MTAAGTAVIFAVDGWKVLRKPGNSYIIKKQIFFILPLFSLAGQNRRGSCVPEMEDFVMSAGLKLEEFVRLSCLEILHKGRDYDSTQLTITDVNRPGLQFQGFYDYFDPMRLQVIGKAEVMYLKGLQEDVRRKC